MNRSQGASYIRGWRSATIPAGVGLAVGGVLLYRVISAPGPKPPRAFSVIAVDQAPSLIHCHHRAGVCTERELYIDGADRVEATRRQWRACVTAGRCEALAAGPDDDTPVTGITWRQARDYCAWRGGKLPELDDWERLARLPDGRRYPWGDEAPTCALANAKGCDGAPTKATRTAGANPLGIEDLAGNVAEYVQHGIFGQDEPTGPWTVRGGSFLDPPEALDATRLRTVTGPAPDVGVRCVYDDVFLHDDAPWAIEITETEPMKRARLAAVAASAPPPAHAVTLQVTATYQSPEGSYNADYRAKATEALARARIAVVDPAAPSATPSATPDATPDARVEITCAESDHGKYSYQPTYSPYAGGGMDGTAVDCAIAITPASGAPRVDYKVRGETPSSSTSLYFDAVEDLEEQHAWRAMGLIVVAALGDAAAAPELARVSWLAADTYGDDGTILADLALRHAAVLEPRLTAFAHVAKDDPIAAARLGEPAREALALWAAHGYGFRGDDPKMLAHARGLLAAGPLGEQIVAQLMQRLPDDDGEHFASYEVDAILPWLQLVTERGSHPDLLAAVRRWDGSKEPTLTAPVAAAIAALQTRKP